MQVMDAQQAAGATHFVFFGRGRFSRFFFNIKPVIRFQVIVDQLPVMRSDATGENQGADMIALRCVVGERAAYLVKRIGWMCGPRPAIVWALTRLWESPLLTGRPSIFNQRPTGGFRDPLTFVSVITWQLKENIPSGGPSQG